MLALQGMSLCSQVFCLGLYPTVKPEHFQCNPHPSLLRAENICCGLSLHPSGGDLFSHRADTSHAGTALTQTPSSLFIYIAPASSKESKNKELALSKQLACLPREVAVM